MDRRAFLNGQLGLMLLLASSVSNASKIITSYDKTNHPVNDNKRDELVVVNGWVVFREDLV